MERNPSTRAAGQPFDDKIIEAVWQMGTLEPHHPSFRKDACGASMQRSKYGKTEQWDWKIDHKEPVAKGVTDYLSNL